MKEVEARGPFLVFATGSLADPGSLGFCVEWPEPLCGEGEGLSSQPGVSAPLSSVAAEQKSNFMLISVHEMSFFF